MLASIPSIANRAQTQPLVIRSLRGIFYSLVGNKDLEPAHDLRHRDAPVLLPVLHGLGGLDKDDIVVLLALVVDLDLGSVSAHVGVFLGSWVWRFGSWVGILWVDVLAVKRQLGVCRDWFQWWYEIKTELKATALLVACMDEVGCERTDECDVKSHSLETGTVTGTDFNSLGQRTWAVIHNDHR